MAKKNEKNREKGLEVAQEDEKRLVKDAHNQALKACSVGQLGDVEGVESIGTSTQRGTGDGVEDSDRDEGTF